MATLVENNFKINYYSYIGSIPEKFSKLFHLVNAAKSSTFIKLYETLCAIWYHLYNLRNMKNTHGGVLLLVLKIALLHGCFSRFLNFTNGNKLRNASLC